MAFYELRQYKVLPGKMDEWLKVMEEEIIPFQVSKGMVITGSFRGETDHPCMSGCAASRAKPSARALQGGLRQRSLEREDRAAIPNPSTARRWS